MDPTKIAKSYLKPPSKILKSGSIPKLLPVIIENKSSGSCDVKDQAKNAAVSQKNTNKVFPRRRSKSATDLRLLGTIKPTLTIERTVKPLEKSAPLRIGQKRPITQKNEEPNKPKVARVKIPDWDYKSRFQELQKKYHALQDEHKQIKTQVSNLPILEEEVKALRESNKINQDQLELLTKNEQKLIEEKIEVLQENNTLKNELSKSVKDYQMLKNHHEAIENENKENQSRLKSLQEALNASELAVTCLKEKCASLDFATQQLKRDLEEHENLRRSLHNTIQDMKGNIRVFCRVRPPIDNEEIEKQQCSIFFPSETTLEIRKSRESVSVTGGKNMDLKQEFNFDKVFPPEANQTEVFEELSQLVQSALDGYHVCVFAYGQTGSGKTYTMQGSTHDHGMIPRTIDLIFDKIDKLAIGDWTYTVMASFLEIYNENVKDLLSPNSTHNYELRYNEGRGVTVTNLQIVHIASAAELKTLMEEAHKNRAVAATDFNEHSSRSHAVTKIHLEGYHKNSKTKYAGSVNLVDLAGSESAKTSAAERLNETKSINKSLSTLGSVMLALHNKDSHVPYRNSKLTFLLQSCLGGNSKTLMFVNISPFEECFYESINSLRFAAKVKDIKINAKRNKTYGMMTPLQTKH